MIDKDYTTREERLGRRKLRNNTLNFIEAFGGLVLIVWFTCVVAWMFHNIIMNI